MLTKTILYLKYEALTHCYIFGVGKKRTFEALVGGQIVLRYGP